MWYEINVSFMGKHLFTTHKRSLSTSAEYHQVLDLIVKKFPIEEEYFGDRIPLPGGDHDLIRF